MMRNIADESFSAKAKSLLQLHFVGSTAILAESTPVLAAFETLIAGMSVHVSMNARLLAAGLTYFGGTGYLYAKGRDLSRRLFAVRDTTSERIQGTHDATYLGAFNLVFAPLLYAASGARNLREISIGTATAIAFGFVNGAPMGYTVDLFRDLTGLKECNRPSYPQSVKKMTPKIKLTLAVLLTAAGMAVTGGIYALKG
jgi:hypothetical protein